MPAADTGSDEEITLRYQLTPAFARQAFWFAVREWMPWLVGIGLLTLVCATWSALGKSGQAAAVALPVAVALMALYYWNRSKRSVEPYFGREIVVIFHAAGLRVDSGFSRSEMPWASVRQIARRRSLWLVQARTGSYFYIPIQSFPADAQAAVSRWAAAAGVRLA
jgi:hypothetical protein